MNKFVVSTLALLVASHLNAKTSDNDTENIETLVVTGTKIERTRLDNYASTAVLTQDELEDLGINDIKDAVQRQGNVFYAPSNNGNNGITIRGINSEGVGSNGANIRPMMALTIDGATQSVEGVRRGQRGMWDVSQVEVYRNPQPTLMGRNALAGAINIETNDPTQYTEAAGRVKFDSYGGNHLAAMLSGAISDDFSLRFAAEKIDTKNGISYTDPSLAFLGEDDYQNYRAKLLYQPMSNPELTVKLTVSYTEDDPAIQAIDGKPEDRQYNGQSPVEHRFNKVANYIGDVNYDFTNDWSARSITAYTTTNANLQGYGSFCASDSCDVRLPYQRDEYRNDSDFSQEFRAVRKQNEDGLSGIVGLYFGSYTNDRKGYIPKTLVFQGLDLESESSSKSSAIFGEVRKEFKNGFELTAGARYSYDTTDTLFNDFVTSTYTKTTYKSDAFMPSGSIAYRFGEFSKIALSYSRGYRAGFQDRYITVKPEYINDYEIAYRTSFLENSLQLNVNAFIYDWKDQQISVPNTAVDGHIGETRTENAEQSLLYGSELDLRYFYGATTIGGSLGLLKTEIVKFTSQTTGLDYSGNEFPEAPRASGSLWVNTRFADHWFVSGDVTGRTRSYQSGDLSNEVYVPGYGVVNARIGYEHSNYSVIFNVDNILDKQYISGKDVNGGQYVGSERKFGITLNAKY